MHRIPTASDTRRPSRMRWALALAATVAAAALPASAGAILAPGAVTGTPAGPSNATSRTVTWLAPTPDVGCVVASFERSVSQSPTVPGAFAPAGASGSLVPIGPGDGTWYVHIRAVQAVAVLGSICPASPSAATGPLSLDTAAAPPGVSGGPATSPTNTAAAITYNLAGEAGAAFAWSFARAGGATLNGVGAAATLPGPAAEGAYTFTARQTDPAGNTSAVATRAFTVDRTAPTVTISGANIPLTRFIPNFNVQAPGAASFAWSLTGPTPRTGTTNPVNLAGIADGSYQITATATDAAGNTGSTAAPRTFTLDSTPPPAPTINGSVPNGASVNSVPGYTLADTEAGVAFAWSLTGPVSKNGGGATVSLSPLATDGLYTLVATATDPAGNTSAESTSRTFRLDRQSPAAPTITPDILSIVNTPPVATLSGGGEVVSYRWQLDSGAVQSNASIGGLSALADGNHTIVAWSIDAAGNESARTTRPFKLDRNAPDPPQLTAIPSATNSVPSITITAPSGTTISWALTGAKALTGQGSSPLTPALGNLPDGDYTFTARARSSAGNPSAAVTANFRIDTRAPAAPTILSGPASDRGGPKPLFTWSGESGGSFVWQVTRGDLVAQGPVTTTDRTAKTAPLVGGRYVFHVQQVDAAGNLGPESQFAFAIRGTVRARIAGSATTKPLLVRPYGPLFPKSGRLVTGRSQLTLHWVFRSGRKSLLYNVQLFDEKGHKILSAFPKKARFTVPVKYAKPGVRLYWQVWPFFGATGRYARKPLGVSYFDVAKRRGALAAER